MEDDGVWFRLLELHVSVGLFMVFDGECRCLGMFSRFSCIRLLSAWLTSALLNRDQIIWANSHFTFEHLRTPRTLCASLWNEILCTERNTSLLDSLLVNTLMTLMTENLYTLARNKLSFRRAEQRHLIAGRREYWTRTTAADVNVFFSGGLCKDKM